MRKVLILFSLLWAQSLTAQVDLTTHFEKTNGKETVTYEEGIKFLEVLDKQFPSIQLQTLGKTDMGVPLHYAMLSLDGDFDLASLRQKGKTIILINNNIHAGEPDGVDASLMLFRDIARQGRQEPKPDLVKAMYNIVLVMIPFYNVGGVLNRNNTTRVNQNGPVAYGFRGNAQNYDLNRDFIKQDTENARTFAQLFQQCKPDIYIENHTTNGADYQYVITYLATQPDKLGGKSGEYLRQTFIPDLEKRMEGEKMPISPYVTAFGDTPDKGFGGFLDTPRYSSGYASLFGTFSFIVESHMLKPFKQRVEGTYLFMKHIILHTHTQGEKIRHLVLAYREEMKTKMRFTLNWARDTEKSTNLLFLGYEPSKKISKVTGQERLFYDKTKPIQKMIAYKQFFKPALEVDKPLAYLIPQGWQEVISRLERGGVKIQKFKTDKLVKVQTYYIENYETLQKPFEGHYLHTQVQVRQETQQIQFFKGDCIVIPDQETNRFIIETLEPQGSDSFFCWNFFDSILQQKEYFSDYIFEEVAERLLAEDAVLKQRFEAKKLEDADFAKDAGKQLDFIYKNSPYYEKSHLRYPVFRLTEVVDLD